MTTNPFRIDDQQLSDAVAAMTPEQAAPFQAILEQRQAGQQRLNTLVAERRFNEALVMVGSEERAQNLVAWATQMDLTDDEVRDLLTHYWSMTEAWQGDPILRGGMYGLLERVAPLVVLDDTDPRPLPDTDTLVVYRGNLGEVPFDAFASWTLDQAIAERFARMAMSPRGMFLGMYREDGVPTVWRGIADHDAVLGYFDDRGEQEVVLPPGACRRVAQIAHMDTPQRGTPFGIGQATAAIGDAEPLTQPPRTDILQP